MFFKFSHRSQKYFTYLHYHSKVWGHSEISLFFIRKSPLAKITLNWPEGKSRNCRFQMQMTILAGNSWTLSLLCKRDEETFDTQSLKRSCLFVCLLWHTSLPYLRSAFLFMLNRPTACWRAHYGVVVFGWTAPSLALGSALAVTLLSHDAVVESCSPRVESPGSWRWGGPLCVPHMKSVVGLRLNLTTL